MKGITFEKSIKNGPVIGGKEVSITENNQYENFFTSSNEKPSFDSLSLKKALLPSIGNISFKNQEGYELEQDFKSDDMFHEKKQSSFFLHHSKDVLQQNDIGKIGTLSKKMRRNKGIDLNLRTFTESKSCHIQK